MTDPERMYGSDSISGQILNAANRVTQHNSEIEAALVAAKRLEAEALQRAFEAEAARQVAENNEREALKRQLEDPLTGCLNQHYFEKYAKESFDPIRDDGKVGLVFIDINDFKIVNDTYGHAFGDGMLRVMADLLKSASRKSGNTVIRLGGDEFVIISKKAPSDDGSINIGEGVGTGMSFEDSLGIMVERILAEANKNDPPLGFAYGIAIYDKMLDEKPPESMGPSVYVRDVEDNSPLAHTLMRADAIMYAHKKAQDYSYPT